MSDQPVFLVEDDALLREATVQALQLAGLTVEPFESAARAARNLSPGFAGCIVSDIRMEGMDGLQLFARVQELDDNIPVILITGHGDVEMAVRAMRDGAFDFIAKPFSADHLAAVVDRALEARRLVLDNRALRKALDKPQDDLSHHSRAMIQLQSMVSRVALTDVDVIIEGEAGTGKELWARQLHRQSRRYAQPFVVLGGTAAGASSSIDEHARQAAGGTLFLDGCDALSEPAQIELVTLLDARDRARATGNEDYEFRLVASSTQPLPASGLREDLAYRLGSVILRVPPLRDRREDIAELFATFIGEALSVTGARHFEMSNEDRKRLLEHDWPGNVRELKNYAFATVLGTAKAIIGAGPLTPARNLAARVAEFERMVIVETLEATQGNVVRACAMLETPRKTFYEKLSRHRIDPTQYRQARS